MTRQSSTRPGTDRHAAGSGHGPVVPSRHARDIRYIRVAEIMSSPPIAIRADAPLDIALATFAVHGVRHLAVVDDAGRCVGMLTDRVVTAHWAMRPMTFARMCVSRVCDGTRPFATPRSTLMEVARVLRHCATDAVVVVDVEGRPLGVVTTSDLVAVVAKPRLG